jgi:hypothetical protein
VHEPLAGRPIGSRGLSPRGLQAQEAEIEANGYFTDAGRSVTRGLGGSIHRLRRPEPYSSLLFTAGTTAPAADL